MSNLPIPVHDILTSLLRTISFMKDLPGIMMP